MKHFSILIMIIFSLVGSSYSQEEIYPINPLCSELNFEIKDHHNQIIVSPSDASNLQTIIDNAQENTTIIFEDGTYDISSIGKIRIHKNDITLRSQSGIRENVILDGAYSTYGIEIIGNNIELIGFTIKRFTYHPIHIKGSDNTLIHDMHILDGREQLIKINKHDFGDGNVGNNFGRISCSKMELTASGRSNVRNHGGNIACYTGGIDMHDSWRWNIHDNVVENIYCENRAPAMAEHAIHLWQNTEDVIVERNFIINNARGIGFGLGASSGAREYIREDYLDFGLSSGPLQNIGGTIRNNVIYSDLPNRLTDSGIALERSYDTQVYHNTVYIETPDKSAIDIVYDYSIENTIKNNIVYGKRGSYDVINFRGGANQDDNVLENNIIIETTDIFRDSSALNFELVPEATQLIDQGSQTQVANDFNGFIRDTYPDIGAYEFDVDEIGNFVYPEITFSSNTTQIISGGKITLSWGVTNAQSCEAKRDWSGSKTLTGEVSLGPLTRDAVFILECVGNEEYLISSEEITIDVIEDDSPDDSDPGDEITNPDNGGGTEVDNDTGNNDSDSPSDSQNDRDDVIQEEDVVVYAQENNNERPVNNFDESSCKPDYQYSNWTQCSNGYSLREITDKNNCFSNSIEKKECDVIKQIDTSVQDQSYDDEKEEIIIKRDSYGKFISNKDLSINSSYYLGELNRSELLITSQNSQKTYLALQDENGSYSIEKEVIEHIHPIENTQESSINIVPIVLIITLIILGVLIRMRYHRK